MSPANNAAWQIFALFEAITAAAILASNSRHPWRRSGKIFVAQAGRALPASKEVVPTQETYLA